LKIYINVKEKNDINLKYLLTYHIAREIHIREKEREENKMRKSCDYNSTSISL